MSNFIANTPDLLFNLRHNGSPPVDGWDDETISGVITEVARLAEGPFAASWADADRNPPTYDPATGKVTLPESLKASLDAFYDAGWDKLFISEKLGGTPAPPSVKWAVQELLVGANPAAYFYAVGTMMAEILAEEGTAAQVARFAKPMIDQRWGGTMVLTEPEAGSDVGAGTTSAKQIDGETYEISGVKRFITSGAGDYFDNIIHLVLARPEGAKPGTKGLSLFIVPQFHVDEDGNMTGEENGVKCTGIEHKLGIKASTTCELTFGADKPAIGYLVGGVHDGIRQMFLVIEQARMLIGTKSASTVSSAYLNALSYALERIQGQDITKVAAGERDAPKIPIIDHADVRRLLADLKAHAEGMRALVQYAGACQDRAVPGADDAAKWAARNDLLLPLVKGYCSEAGFTQIAQALQVAGGSGYCEEYPWSQMLRDMKIDSLYEGTTAVQALDLTFRKLVRDQMTTWNGLADDIKSDIAASSGRWDDLNTLVTTFEQNVLTPLGGWLINSAETPAELHKVGLRSVDLLNGAAELVISWLLLKQADAALTDDVPADFIEGKNFVSRWWLQQVALPYAEARAARTATTTSDVMSLPISSW